MSNEKRGAGRRGRRARGGGRWAAALAWALVTACADPAPPSSARLSWLETDAGERRGFAIQTDLAAEGPKWELWSAGSAGASTAPAAALARIDQLCPDAPRVAVNGGFWNEEFYPVGACAGERGIAAAFSHRWGIALGERRAWIGALTADVELRGATGARHIALNPLPLPRGAPFLIDARAYPYPIVPATDGRIAWLDGTTSGPLRFNTTRQFTVSRVADYTAGVAVGAPPPGKLLWLRPGGGEAATDDSDAPAAGQIETLTLKLEPVEGEVRLATCAGPLLLEGGESSPALTAMSEAQRTRRESRTLAGCDATGGTLWIVLLVRGRDGGAGVSLMEAARTLKELGATEGLNLDGGSSTCVWTNGVNPELERLIPYRRAIHHALLLPGMENLGM